MTPFLRTLEDWTTFQDYLWFLAAVAWLSVAAAIVRRRARSTAEPMVVAHEAWYFALAASGVASAGLELALLAQDLAIPYIKFDAAMGSAQALGVCAMLALAHGRSQPNVLRGLVLVLPVAALAVLRTRWPIIGGGCLCLAGLFSALRVARLLRRGDLLPELDSAERRLATAAVVSFSTGGVLATHGPIAQLAGEPRLNCDLSHFALPAVLLLLAAGSLFAVAVWRQQLRRPADADEDASANACREFGRGLAVLAIWLAAGLALSVWNGRVARQAFENGLLRRATSAAALVPRDLVDASLGRDLKIEHVYAQRYQDGYVREIAVVPGLQSPAFDRWRTVLQSLVGANPDVPAVSVEAIRDRWLFLAATSLWADRRKTTFAAQLDSRVAFETPVPFLEGPSPSYLGGEAFLARAPLFRSDDPHHPAGWLVFGVPATQWTAAFTLARVQGMILAALGIAAWTMMLVHRLRREKRLAAERRAASAIESAQLKSAFLAKVSHELRTPIQSVLGYGELIANAPLEAETRRWVDALRSHGEILLRLVNDLLDVGALEAGAFRLHTTSVDLRTLLSECVGALRVTAEAKGLALEMQITGELPAYVETDPVRVRQILLNLLGNAVKFTPAGKVTLIVSSHYAVANENAVVEFLVDDTGPGITAEKRPQLFKPFVQLQTTHEGTGLGLSLVAGLCAAMNGSVRCEDKIGPGTAFRVRLPMAVRAQAKPAAATSRSAVGYHGRRILVADDNALVREFLADALRLHGIDVITAADGKAAVLACCRHRPDTVVLDVAMPVMDGYAAAAAIREILGARIHIVGLSAHAQPEEEKRARSAGMDAFLTKPVSLEKLHAILAVAKPTDPAAEIPRSDSWPQLRQRLWAQFEIETPQIIAELRAAVRDGQWDLAKAKAHYLKGSADVIGRPSLQATCRTMLEADLGSSHCDAESIFHEIEVAAAEACAAGRPEDFLTSDRSDTPVVTPLRNQRPLTTRLP